MKQDLKLISYNHLSHFLKVAGTAVGGGEVSGDVSYKVFKSPYRLFHSIGFSLKCCTVRVKKFMTVFPLFTGKDASQYLIQWCS